MVLIFSENAWEDYEYWQKVDKTIVKKIHALIRDIKRNPFDGIGKPEVLKYDLAGYWSRRIDREHRLVYRVVNNELFIYACRFHYDG